MRTEFNNLVVGKTRRRVCSGEYQGMEVRNHLIFFPDGFGLEMSSS
jgi:hypothetical protein